MNDRFKNAFDKIHAEESLKNNTLAILNQKAESCQKHTFSAHIRPAAATACLILVLLGIGSYSFLAPVSAISVDINPSIELSLNRFDRVVSVKGYNDDGRRLVDSLDIRFSEYTDALNTIMENETVLHCLSRGEIVTITVLGENEKKSGQILSDIQSCDAVALQNVYCDSASSEETHAAHEAGLSFGKYRAFLELQRLNPDITVEDIRDMSMREIRDRINALSGNTSESNSCDNYDTDDSSDTGENSDTGTQNSHQFQHKRKHGSDTAE